MTVQRYRHSIYGMAEEAEGEWVDFEDFEALAIERDGLRGRVSELERLVEMGPVPPACSAEDFAGAVLEVDIPPGGDEHRDVLEALGDE